MKKIKRPSFENIFPWLLIVGSIIGLAASVILTVEKLHLAANPNYIPSCSISPVVACSPVIGSWQGEVFGIPNPLIGIFGFACVLTVGMTLLAGAKIPRRWYWLTFQAGTLFGLLFCAWLISQSLYDIGKLCVYCMAVWAVTIPIFWASLAWNIKQGHLKLTGRLQNLLSQHTGKFTVLTYLVVIGLIFVRFSDYFHSLLR